MLRRMAMGLVVVLPALVAAEDKPAAKPAGTYTREAGERKVSFTFKADTVVIQVDTGTEKITIDAAYGVTKDGLLFAAITKVDRTGDGGGPTKDDLFGFKYEVSKGGLTISDLKGTHVNEDSKKLVEGEYKKAEK